MLKPVKRFMGDLHPKEENAEKDPSTAGEFKQVRGRRGGDRSDSTSHVLIYTSHNVIWYTPQS